MEFYAVTATLRFVYLCSTQSSFVYFSELTHVFTTNGTVYKYAYDSLDLDRLRSVPDIMTHEIVTVFYFWIVLTKIHNYCSSEKPMTCVWPILNSHTDKKTLKPSNLELNK